MWGALVKPISDLIGKVLDKAVPDAGERDRLKAEIQAQLINMDSKELDAATSIILAEANGASWLQRNWRPMLMCLFGIIIANNYIINPWFNELFDLNVIMEVPEQMWSLLKLGVSGYVVGRSVEKGLDIWKKKGN